MRARGVCLLRLRGIKPPDTMPGRGNALYPMFRCGAVLLGVFLAFCGFPPTAARADMAPSVMIVAGMSIGPVRLGMTAAAVTAVLGKPTPADNGQVTFPRVGMAVTLADDVAVQVSTTNPQFRTPRGLGVGIGLDDCVRLIGDPNQTVAVDGNDTTINYPFQGIGFVFRGGRAAEVFVVQAVARNPSLPPPIPDAIPALPPGDELAQSPPPADTTPPVGVAPTAAVASAATVTLEARDLTEAVDASRGILRITGTLAQNGQQALDRVSVVARVLRAVGPAGGEPGAVAQVSLPPGGPLPFTLDVSVAQSVVTQYTVEAFVSGAGSTRRFALGQRSVSREAYADLARARMQVSVALGAPSNIGPRVQVLVAIAGTGPIPLDWVRQVDVEIPFTGGTTMVTLVPGQTQTILVPSVARVGDPQVQRVLLNAS